MRKAVVVSIDFSAQELRVIADRSQDPNMLACFVGDHKKDMHALTGTGIIKRKSADSLCRMLGKESASAEDISRWRTYSYEVFEQAMDEKNGHPDYKLTKVIRPLGKKTNFTTEYGAQAPKLAETLIIPVEEAQQYIDAKQEMFARAEAWKQEVIALAHRLGYGQTMLGARRHLPALYSSNSYDVMQAERQAVNFEVQGSCAEMTKQAEGRLWKAGLFHTFDARYIGPIHDELVSSVRVEEALPFIKEKHRLMTRRYADMKVPIVGSISLGANFGQQIECGDDFNEEAILEALHSLGYQDTIMTTA
jgi:DNA polymerase I-like protein with 3'-5' exonuclease and polymerase domains